MRATDCSCSVDDAPALADAVCRLLADPELARALGQNLQRLVQSEFTGLQSAQRYTDLARELRRSGFSRDPEQGRG